MPASSGSRIGPSIAESLLMKCKRDQISSMDGGVATTAIDPDQGLIAKCAYASQLIQ
jgi:hypothetical protein